MRPGARIIVTAQWSSFYGMKGTVNATSPHLMITIDGDTYPIRMGAREVAPLETAPHHGGAE